MTVGIIISAFLYFVKPFDLNRAGDLILKFSIYFGLIAFAVSFVYDLFITFVLGFKTDLPSWTFLKWMLSTLGLIICISFANYLLMKDINNWPSPLTWEIFINVFVVTLIVGFFPIFFFGSMKVIRLKNVNQNIASSLHVIETASSTKEINIIFSDRHRNIKMEKNLFLYAQSMQNYIHIYSFSDEGIERDTLRSTMRDLENLVSDGDILRCHRSFLINIINVESVTGNAQGLKLKIKNFDEKIPVSRKYIDAIRQKMI